MLPYKHIFPFLTSFRLPQPQKLSRGREAACIWDLKRVEGELGVSFAPAVFPITPCSFPSQAVHPNRYLNVRRISAWPGLRPCSPDSRGGGARCRGSRTWAIHYCFPRRQKRAGSEVEQLGLKLGAPTPASLCEPSLARGSSIWDEVAKNCPVVTLQPRLSRAQPPKPRLQLARQARSFSSLALSGRTSFLRLLDWPREPTNEELREAGLGRRQLQEDQQISSWPRRGLRLGEGQQVFLTRSRNIQAPSAMASRGGGRGRGRGQLTFNMEAVGIGKGDALPPPTLQPSPLFPPLEFRPVPLPSGEEGEYVLALKQELRGAMRQLPYFIRPAVPKRDVERYSDKYQMSGPIDNAIDWNPDWRRLPRELKIRVRKLQKERAPILLPKRPPKTAEDKEETIQKLETLEKKEEEVTSEEEEDKEEEEKEEEEEEEYDEEEHEEETDYIMSYFDNGEDFGGDSDDNMDEAIY
ncbi:DNA-directed RNA polymerase III subunit RPC7-like isoform X1 [Lepus europaeus]|nr:DNA-directed RNA polymerase III subunit RPC7-like isoform X1 [Lepus europaeus]